MNKRKWQDPMVPLSMLALKLCEEAAEVGTEITDGYFHDPIFGQADRRKLLEELEHVEFIAAVIRARVNNE